MAQESRKESLAWIFFFLKILLQFGWSGTHHSALLFSLLKSCPRFPMFTMNGFESVTKCSLGFHVVRCRIQCVLLSQRERRTCTSSQQRSEAWFMSLSSASFFMFMICSFRHFVSYCQEDSCWSECGSAPIFLDLDFCWHNYLIVPFRIACCLLWKMTLLFPSIVLIHY